MSVFTTVERDELVEFLRHYQTGELLAFEGISDGIENTRRKDPNAFRRIMVMRQKRTDQLPLAG